MRVWSYPGIYPYPEGGDPATGIFIHKQNLALKEAGVEVNVILPRDWYPCWPFYNLFNGWRRHKEVARPAQRTLDGVQVFHPLVVVPRPSRIFKKHHGEYVIDAVVKFLKKQGVQQGKDVILAQWLIPDGFIALRIAQELGIACAVEMQGDDIQVWPHRSKIHLENSLWVLENANLMLGCSDFLCNEGRKLLNKDRDFHTVYTGIDLDVFKPSVSLDEVQKKRHELGLKDDDIVILNVGSAIARKGWLELFAAVRNLKIKFTNLKILAASGGLKEFDLREKAEEFEVEDMLVDLGTVRNSDLPSLYQACDIFCLPSHWEGLANVLCEAMSTGCAVVTTAVSGHPEVVVSGFNGELVPPKDVPALTEALARVVESKSLRLEYGIQARLMAESKIMSHKANAEKLVTLLKTIV